MSTESVRASAAGCAAPATELEPFLARREVLVDGRALLRSGLEGLGDIRGLHHTGVPCRDVLERLVAEGKSYGDLN
jgi:hypothetical protein